MENITENPSILHNSLNKRCIFIKENGEQCNSIPLKNDVFCYFHSPAMEEERKRSVSKGGKRKIIVISENSNSNLIKNLPFKLNSVKRVTKFYELLINETLSGNIDLRIATGLGYLLSGLLKSLELSEIEERLEGIENLIMQKTKSETNEI